MRIAWQWNEPELAVERRVTVVFVVHKQTGNPDKAGSGGDPTHRLNQQRTAGAAALKSLIHSQAPQKHGGDGTGQAFGQLGWQRGRDSLARRQLEEADDPRRCRRIGINQDKRARNALFLMLPGGPPQKVVQCRHTAVEAFAVVLLRQGLHFNHGSSSCVPGLPGAKRRSVLEDCPAMTTPAQHPHG